MSRSRLLSSIAAASVGIALLGACSAESLTERAVSFGLEQAAEGDQDIDLDFGSEGGGFSISTDEGDFAINFDEDSGGIVFNTDEGDGVISFDEDGIVFNTDEGDGVIGFDTENGVINFDTDEGDGQINFSEDGDVTVTTDEGDFGLTTSGGAPDDWPSAIGRPESLTPGSETYTELDMTDGTRVTAASFNHSPNEPFLNGAVKALENQGWTVGVSTETPDGGIFAQLTRGDQFIQMISDNTGYSSITLSR